jgi:hypothetical protein
MKLTKHIDLLFMVKSLSKWKFPMFLDILRRAEVWPGEATGKKERGRGVLPIKPSCDELLNGHRKVHYMCDNAWCQ